MAEKRTDTPEYRGWYRKGWKYSQGPSATLDYADSRGLSTNTPWMDGYLDYAAGRAMWHRLHCPDHDTCGEA